MDKFCQECGNRLEENQAFCAECGTSVQQTVKEEKAPGVTQTGPATPVPPKAKKPMTFKKKILVSLVSMLIIGLIAGHYVIQAKTSPQDKIDAFLSALSADDAKAAMAAIEIPQGTEKNEQVFMSYLNEQNMNDLQTRMYEAASEVIGDGIPRNVTHENGTDLFRISKNTFIGIYPVINIEVIPVEAKLTTDLKSGEYQLGNKTIDLGKENELGSYLPGIYPSSFTAKSGKVMHKMEQEQPLVGGEEVVIELISDTLMVKVWSNDPKSIVYLNGESTGKTIEELPMIGPISDEEEIKVYVERKGEKGAIQKSEEITASAGDFAELPIYSSETGSGKVAGDTTDTEEKVEEEPEKTSVFQEDQLIVFIQDFRSSYENALNNKDFSQVDSYLMKDSLARKELVEFIGDLGNDYFLYEFNTDQVTATDIQGEKAFVTTYEEFDFTNHLGEILNYERNKEYELVLEGTEYKISKINILETNKE